MSTERTPASRQDATIQPATRPSPLSGEPAAERYLGQALAQFALGRLLGAPVNPAAMVAMQRQAGNHAVVAALRNGALTRRVRDGALAQEDEEEALRKGSRATSSDREALSPSAPVTPVPTTRPFVDSGGRRAGWGTAATADVAPTAWGVQRRAQHGASQTPSWGAAGGIRPAPISWGLMAFQGEAAHGVDFAAAIGPPGGTTLLTIQGFSGGDSTVGWTYFPTNHRAPDFKFNSTDKGSAGAPKWYASPTSVKTAFEGDAKSYFATAGLHKTTKVEGGKDVYFDISAAMSTRDSSLEQEHCDDIMAAYNMSLKEAEDVLVALVYSVDFGPKPTKAAAEQMVLDTIKANLTHPGLGNDKTTWAATYNTLFRKTLTRDTSGWHMFGLTNRRTNAAGDVLYDLATGSTKLVPTSTVIKY